MNGIIYTKYLSPRLQYCVDFIGKIYNSQLQLTTDAVIYENFQGFRINYSPERITAGEVWIHPYTLLFETGVRHQNVECFTWNGLPAFFKTSGDMPFDVFAGIFYLLSRYEEYLPHNKDAYGRYAHANSVAFKNNFLHLPLVNLWLKALAELHFSLFTIHYSPFTFTPTYDIDIAYSYKAKGYIRNTGGWLKDIAKGRWRQVRERWNVLVKNTGDPFDTFLWLDALHSQHQLEAVYFFLLAGKPKGYDKNIPPNTTEMQALVAKHSSLYQTGIHPSWQSGHDAVTLQSEIKTLQNIIKKPVTRSRQHYVRIEFPATYRRLIAAGIQEDYSMGYGSINGFRASVATPFYWFDLEKNETTPLLIYSFCYMEANSFFEQHFTPQQAAVELQQYYDTVKHAGGHLITIFHNHFITTQPQWMQWRQLYREFIERNFRRLY